MSTDLLSHDERQYLEKAQRDAQAAVRIPQPFKTQDRIAGEPTAVSSLVPGEHTVRTYCNFPGCGAEFQAPAFHSKSRDKYYPMQSRCETHRDHPNPAPVESNEDRKARFRAVLDARWKAICPEAYRDIDPSTIANEAVRKAIQSYTPKHGKGLLMQGGSGTHKSRGSHRLMQDLYYAGKSVIIFHSGEFFEQCLTSFSQDRHETWLLNIVRAGHVLFDDLGHEKFSDASARAFYAIIDRRLAEKRPTHFNTNFDSKTLLQHVFTAMDGVEILRRMADSCTIVKTGETDIFGRLSF